MGKLQLAGFLLIFLATATQAFTASDIFTKLEYSRGDLGFDEARFQLTNPTASQITLTQANTRIAIQRSVNHSARNYELLEVYNRTIQHNEPTYGPLTCQDTTYANGTPTRTCTQSVISWNNYTTQKEDYRTPFRAYSAGETATFILRFYKAPKLGFQAADWFPGLKIGANWYDRTDWAWVNTSFQYRQNFTVDNPTGSTLTDFPAYLSIDTATLIAAGKMKSDCSDLRIANATHVLDRNIENLTCGLSAAQGGTIVWFRIPSFPTGNYSVSVYYGNPSAVDTDSPFGVFKDYRSVFHGDSIWDALNNNTPLSKLGDVNFVLNNSECKYGYCISFDSYHGSVWIPSGAAWKMPGGTEDSTVSLWFKSNMTAAGLSYVPVYGWGQLLSAKWRTMYYDVSATNLLTQTYGGTAGIVKRAVTDWTKLEFLASQVYGNSSTRTVVNTTHGLGSHTTTSTSMPTDVYIGSADNTSWAGMHHSNIDEFRIAATAFSLDYLAAVANQSAYIAGTEESNFESLVQFINQSPSDLNSTNAVVAGVNITYNYTQLDVNTAYLYYGYGLTVPSTAWKFINGTGYGSWLKTSASDTVNLSITGNSSVIQYRLSDNAVLPATMNLDEEDVEHTPHVYYNLSTANNAILTEFLNVSNATYGFFEIDAYNATSGTSGLRVYYCNSSYEFSSIATTPFSCSIIYTIAAGQQANHQHYEYGAHHVIPFSQLNGQINGVNTTPKGYFLLRPSGAGTTWSVGYVTNFSRAGATRTTSNNGVTWANQSYTLDAHLHQFNASYSFFYVAEGRVGGTVTNGSIRSDELGFSYLPPTAPNVFSPTEATYSNAILSVNWTNSTSGLGFPIAYNVSLLFENLTLSKELAYNLTNNSVVFWSNLSLAGIYVVRVTAYDNASLYSYGYSDNFTILDNVLNETNVYYNPSLIESAIALYASTYQISPLVYNVTNATLYWNLTSYKPAWFNLTAANASAQIPINTNSTTSQWKYDVLLTNGTTLVVWGAQFTQNITLINLSLCNWTNPKAKLNFFIFNETDSTPIDNDTITGTFNVYINNSALAQTFSFGKTLEFSNNFSVCLEEGNVTLFNIFGSVTFSKPNDYDERKYYVINYTPSLNATNYSLYLALASETKYVKFTLQQPSLLPAPGYYAYIQRYFNQNGTYITVVLDKFDDNGVIVTPLVIPDPYYRIIITDGTNIVDTFSQIVVPNTVCSDVCSVTLILHNLGTDSPTSVYQWSKTAASCDFNNSTNVSTCSFLNAVGASQTFNYTVYNRTANNSVVCTSQVTSSAATFTCSLGTLNSNSYLVVLNQVFSDSTVATRASMLINLTNLLGRNLGTLGLFITVLMCIGVALAFSFSPRLMIIGELVAVTVSAALGFLGGLTYAPALLGGAWTVLLATYVLVKE